MVRKYKDFTPEIAEDVFLAENCTVIGRVVLREKANIWYGAVLRGDEGPIEIGEGTNVQDNASIHTAPELPCRLGRGVTVGHNAIVHGCIVGDHTMIGMGACVLNRAVIGEECLIGAGALIREGQEVPPRSLCVGVPARVVRQLTEEEIAHIRNNAAAYMRLAEEYQA